MHLSLVLGTCWALCGACVGHVLEEWQVWPPVSCKGVFSCHGPHSSYPVSSYCVNLTVSRAGILLCSALMTDLGHKGAWCKTQHPLPCNVEGAVPGEEKLRSSEPAGLCSSEGQASPHLSPPLTLSPFTSSLSSPRKEIE